MKAIMKTMKYFLSMAALALVGAMTVSCSSDDNIIEQPQQPETKNNVVTLTTTVSLDGGDATRALSSTGVKTFAAGETMALIYKNKSGNTVKAVSEPLPAGDYGKSATFTFTLENPDKDQNVRYIYPAAIAKDVATDAAIDDAGTINYDALSSQDGTLATLSSSLDLATSPAIAWNGSNLPAVILQNQLAILAVTLKNEAGLSDLTSSTTKLTVSDGTNTYTVNRSAAAGPIYVAIQPTKSATIDITATIGDKGYFKTLTDAKTYNAGNGYPVSWKMTQGVNLSKLTADYTAQNGDMLTGTLSGNYAISITNDASVTLSGVTIDRGNSRDLPGIKCNGNATITLVGSNTVKASRTDWGNGNAGIQVGPNGTTLTIQGKGSLTATGEENSAGIGASYGQEGCGNITILNGNITAEGYHYYGAGIGGGLDTDFSGTITISGGTVTATGGDDSAGIGSSSDASCGDIIINGGTVNATGGTNAAGIGCGYAQSEEISCGNITITSGVTHVTATKGSHEDWEASEPSSIGSGGVCIDEEAGASCNVGDVNIEDSSKVTQE